MIAGPRFCEDCGEAPADATLANGMPIPLCRDCKRAQDEALRARVLLEAKATAVVPGDHDVPMGLDTLALAEEAIDAKALDRMIGDMKEVGDGY